jgi:hypothetical protein
MRTVVLVLAGLAALDLVACGLLLAVVWAEHFRQRRIAAGRREPVPRPATGQFLFLIGLALAGVMVLYGTLMLLLNG